MLPAVASAQGARIQLDHLNRLADKAEKVVDVAVDTKMLRETAGFLAGKDANTGKSPKLIQNVTGIYVKVRFKEPAQYTTADLEAIRKAGQRARLDACGQRASQTDDRSLLLQSEGREWGHGGRFGRTARADRRQYCRPYRSRLAGGNRPGDSEAAWRRLVFIVLLLLVILVFLVLFVISDEDAGQVSHFTAISNRRGQSLPVTKILFACAS
jgi:hypothetical protein